jgi:hypothetical protein
MAGAAVNHRARHARPGPGVAECVVIRSTRNGWCASISPGCANTRIDRPYGRSETGSDPKPIPNAVADRLADTGAHHRSDTHSDDDTHSLANCEPDAHANAHSNSHSDTHANGHPHTDTYTNGNSQSNTHANGFRFDNASVHPCFRDRDGEPRIWHRDR